MTSVWVAEHGWTYLMAIIDCCTREIVAWQLELRCRADEAIASSTAPPPSTDRAGRAHARLRQRLRLHRPPLQGRGSPNSAIRHRRGGYRDPESQAFIESWFGKLKEREVWLNEYETLDDARRGIAGYVDRYHHRPHSGLGYRTPDEVAGPGRMRQTRLTQAA